MQLIAPLASGFAQAPLGTAVLKLRGTATAAPYWTDFEGTAAGSTGVAIPLDSYGKATRYVNALVDVTVYNASGALVGQFTCGESAPNVEVRSQSFTGAPWGGGGSAANLPTTLQAVLDLWLTNAGSIDWKVLVNGTAMTLASALSSAALGLVFNVKSADYAGGAEGDGATNDYAAVAAAVAACSAAGGGIVWFPPGTYRINSKLDVPDGVMLAGAGPGSSNVLIGQTTDVGIDVLAGTVGQQIIGLKFSHNTAAAQILVRFTATKLNVSNCEFDGNATTSTLLASTAASAITLAVDSCRFYPNTSRRAIDTSSVTAANTIANITRCYVEAPATNSSQDLFRVYGGVFVGCLLDFSEVASGSPRGIDGSNGGIVTGCRFLDAALGVTWYGVRCPEEGTGFTFCESANEFGQGTDPLNGHAYDFTATEALLGSRNDRWVEITEAVAAGSITVFIKEFGRCEHNNTASGAKTVLADSLGPKHACADLLFRCGGAGGNYTASTTWFHGTFAFNLTSSSVRAGFRVFNSGHSGFSTDRWHVLDAVVR